MVLLGQNMNQQQTPINNIEGALDILNIDVGTRNEKIMCLNKVFGTSP